MCLALHKLYKVSGLSMGEASYEEYVPTREELHLLKAQHPMVYDRYWELICHFHICGHMTKLRI